MITIQLPGGVIEVHDSPHHLPEKRRVEAECYGLISAGIGNTSQDIVNHFAPVTMLIGTGNDELLTTEVNNLYYLLVNLLNKQIAPNSLEFGCLVETVNGEKWGDYTEEGLTKLVGILSGMGLTQAHISGSLHDLKKKS